MVDLNISNESGQMSVAPMDAGALANERRIAGLSDEALKENAFNRVIEKLEGSKGISSYTLSIARQELMNIKDGAKDKNEARPSLWKAYNETLNNATLDRNNTRARVQQIDLDAEVNANERAAIDAEKQQKILEQRNLGIEKAFTDSTPVIKSFGGASFGGVTTQPTNYTKEDIVALQVPGQPEGTYAYGFDQQSAKVQQWIMANPNDPMIKKIKEAVPYSGSIAYNAWGGLHSEGIYRLETPSDPNLSNDAIAIDAYRKSKPDIAGGIESISAQMHNYNGNAPMAIEKISNGDPTKAREIGNAVELITDPDFIKALDAKGDVSLDDAMDKFKTPEIAGAGGEKVEDAYKEAIKGGLKDDHLGPLLRSGNPAKVKVGIIGSIINAQAASSASLSKGLAELDQAGQHVTRTQGPNKYLEAAENVKTTTEKVELRAALQAQKSDMSALLDREGENLVKLGKPSNYVDNMKKEQLADINAALAKLGVLPTVGGVESVPDELRGQAQRIISERTYTSVTTPQPGVPYQTKQLTKVSYDEYLRNEAVKMIDADYKSDPDWKNIKRRMMEENPEEWERRIAAYSYKVNEKLVIEEAKKLAGSQEKKYVSLEKTERENNLMNKFIEDTKKLESGGSI